MTVSTSSAACGTADRVTRSGLFRDALPDDPYLRWAFPLDVEVQGWTCGQAVGWLRKLTRRGGAGWLTVVGAPADAEVVVSTARAEMGDALSGATLPRLLARPEVGPTPPGSRLSDEANDWDWFLTYGSPPVQPGEDLVAWASPDDEPQIQALLDEHSARHSMRVGEDAVRRWCVMREESGELVACAAYAEYVPGVPHLGSIVTHSARRGRGLGAAVTAWITRAILEAGEPVVTLGMYADNDVARRLYRRLGYVDTNLFTSGLFADGSSGASEMPGH